MLFNSVLFITIFLPIALLGWYGLQKLENPAYAKIFLIGMSFWFYGYYNPWYLTILAGSLIMNYACNIAFSRFLAQKAQKWILWLGLAGNLGVLFYFKYFNFFLDNCNFFLHTDFHLEKIALPLGISFFTFQQISFVVDRYWKKAPCYGFLDYACFVTFFPQLIAGPIVLHDEFVPQLQARENRRPQAASFFDGTALFILGLAKKVLLADVLAILVNAVYDDIAIIPYYLDAVSGWLVAISYVLELYFDFSGYCDMARGIGKMFGFVLPENFHSPLKAASVSDFWRRWHMTLSRFLTTYIYIPLGGSRNGMAAKCRNLLIVFLVSGFWHGANWTYVVWGLLNGIATVWETLFPKLKFRVKWANQLFTGIYVTVTIVFFRSDSLQTAGLFIKKMFTGGWSKYNYLFRLCSKLQVPENYAIMKLLQLKGPQYLTVFYVLCVAVLLIIAIRLVCGCRAEVWIEKKGRTVWGTFILASLFVWTLTSLSQVSTFLYFDF